MLFPLRVEAARASRPLWLGRPARAFLSSDPGFVLCPFQAPGLVIGRERDAPATEGVEKYTVPRKDAKGQRSQRINALFPLRLWGFAPLRDMFFLVRDFFTASQRAGRPRSLGLSLLHVALYLLVFSCGSAPPCCLLILPTVQSFL